MVREMIGGCCVCLDERGWTENPLVYCDGSGCNVAVHQACYGINKVPSGSWFCCKCQSQERLARVKCELCPMRDGALKKTDNGGWAHVVCALYIPEVRFGDVGTMEPIILSSVPHERFTKLCYICEDSGRESKSGACMACHKIGCKLSFHVTCAQSKRLLCEEGSVNGNVQYVGYCSNHSCKKQKQAQQSTYVSESEVKKHFKDTKSRSRNESTSSNTSLDSTSKNKQSSKFRLSDLHTLTNVVEFVDEISPATGDGPSSLSDPKKARKNLDSELTFSNSFNSKNLFSINDLLNEEKPKQISPLNTPTTTSCLKDSENSLSIRNIDNVKKNKRKIKEESLLQNKRAIKEDSLLKSKHANDPNKKLIKKKRNKNEGEKKKEETNKEQSVLFEPSQINLVENGKIGSWDKFVSNQKQPANNFQEFLEQQWNDTIHFITSKTQHFDVASLLSCLQYLKSDNMKLEKKLAELQSRRDRLLGLTSRLAVSFDSDNGNTNPLSAMLSKLNESSQNTTSSTISDKKSPQTASVKERGVVSSPDLDMLAAASAKFVSGEAFSAPLQETPELSKNMNENKFSRTFTPSEFFGKDLIQLPP
ncbi:uncharacterized protein LOC100207765 isoform X2 [Hydra vulgaris]|uniref:Uncharacterized protein LOC100207765 isoform X2 n=1 Tax=Hydra vulgaris TaxID=6087 RepID=A0ABM4CVE4_HYDVU